MPKCPRCREEVDHVILIQTKIKRREFKIYADKEEEVQTIQPFSGETERYYCPKCNVQIFYTESEAKEFLRGKGKQIKL